MNKIKLNDLLLKTFTLQNAKDYCRLNNINPNDIKILNLNDNELTDISGIRLFKNLETLYLSYSEINDITDLKYLNNLKYLSLFYNNLTDISEIKYLNNLKYLNIKGNKITDISAVKNLKNLEILNIEYLELESDQINYIKSLNNLRELYYIKGFKDISVINKLNKNIKKYLAD